MEDRIESAIEMGKIPKEIKDQHKGFSEWNSNVTKEDHQSIVQVILVFLFIIKFNLCLHNFYLLNYIYFYISYNIFHFLDNN